MRLWTSVHDGRAVGSQRVGHGGLLCVPGRRRSLRRASGSIGRVNRGDKVGRGLRDGTLIESTGESLWGVIRCLGNVIA